MLFKKKKRSDDNTASEFLKDTILYLHNLAESKGFAKKGFIFNEGLMRVGEVFVKESLSAPFEPQMTPKEFLYSIATSNMQLGMVFGRKCGLGAKNINDLYSQIDSFDSIFQELEILLRDDLCMTFEQWDGFRHFIVPKCSEILLPYMDNPNKDAYVFRTLLSYYLLGVSIGIEKYE